MFKTLLALSFLIATSNAWGQIISAPGSQSAFYKDNAGHTYPAYVVFTTDSGGNVSPIGFNGSMTIGTVNQGSSGASPWTVVDSAWKSDFDAWKVWADVNLSTRASETNLTAFKTANHTDLLGLDTDLISLKSANHTDLVAVKASVDALSASGLATAANQVTLDSDLNSFKSANHADIVATNSAISSFSTANHTDLLGIDSDLLSFKSANHTDLLAVIAAVNAIGGSGLATAANQVTLDSDLNAFKSANHTDVTAQTAIVSTSANQATLDADLNSFKSANHTDVTAQTAVVSTAANQVTLDTDLNSFKSANHSDFITNTAAISSAASQNHTDLNLLDSDLNSFKSAQHTDSTQLDTDLLAFKSSNHTDLIANQPRTATQGPAATLSGAWPVKITDGTNTLAPTSSGSLLVSGLSAVGAAPSLNPVSIAGVDGGGLKRHFLTDTSGRLEIDTAQSLPLPLGASTEATLNAFKTANHNDFVTNTAAINSASTTNHADLIASQPRTVAGDVASGSADSGNPVKMGGVYSATVPTLSTGTRSNLALDENGNVQAVSEQSALAARGMAYDVTTALTNLGTAETVLFILKNPSGSTKTVKITRIRCGTTGGGVFRLYMDPTVTANGTGLTIQNLKAGSASGTATAFVSPTISANGTLMAIEQISAQIGDQDLMKDTTIVLPANNTILITGLMTANNTPSYARVEWLEL